MLLHRLPLAALLVCLALSPAWPAVADESNESKPASVKTWQKNLEAAERELNSDDVSDQRLTDLRDDLLQLESTIRTAQDDAAKQTEELKRDLDALGPAPAEGAPAEAPGVAAKRKHLNADVANAEGLAKEADLLIIRAGRAAESIKQLRRIHFTERALMRTQSPLNPGLWAKALPEWAGLWTSIQEPAKAALMRKGESGSGLRQLGRQLVVGFGLALMLAFPVRRWLANRINRRVAAGSPTDGQRLLVALLTAALNAWLPAMAALAIYLSLSLGQTLSPEAQTLADAALMAAVAAFIVDSFSHAALRPRRPELRLVNLTDATARTIDRVVSGLAALFALDHVVSVFLAQRDVSVEAITLQNLMFGGLVMLLLASLLRGAIWVTDGRSGWPALARLLQLLILGIGVTAVLGYSALSRLLASHVLISIGILVVIWVLMRLVDELMAVAIGTDSRIGLYLRRQLALTEDGAEMLGFWSGGTIKGIVLIAGILVLQILWSVDKRDALLWVQEIFRGFKLGGITVSLADMLMGILVFALLLMATRLLQRTLDRRLFPRTRLDSGLRHSIRSGLGYGGFLLAAIVGVSTMGIDLSKLAIIAGALSVGVGFGLQNIVNNFVSGLILLFERPIKVGDWVVAGEHQGYVKKISVRATEISTFDRASVFIPNSTLISGAVMNRTYADKDGRVLLPIGIDYEADPHLARRVLLELAAANPAVKSNPAPMVMMTGFGESAINLELIAFIHDVDRVKSVTSELCFAIHDAFRQHGIHIPYPQRDMNLKMDDRLFAQLGASRGGKSAPGRS
jgi:small-conductance mechanosensitive channel